MAYLDHWHVLGLAPNEALLKVPFTFDDPFHPSSWGLDIVLPSEARVIGVVLDVEGPRTSPAILAVGNPHAPHAGRSFLILADRKLLEPNQSYCWKVRFVDNFVMRVGRLGGLMWKYFHVFEIPGECVPLAHASLPTVAWRGTITEVVDRIRPSRTLGVRVTQRSRERR